MNTSNYNEPNKGFRDKWFSGRDRELLVQGKWAEIDLGDVPEHDIDGHIRQGYLAECRGDYETAQKIYDSVGLKRDVIGGDGDTLDGEVEHYG